MEFVVRRSKPGFRKFVSSQIVEINLLLIGHTQFHGTIDSYFEVYSKCLHLKELYEAFLCSLSKEEEYSIKYLSDPTPESHKAKPNNYEILIDSCYEKWCDVFFAGNINNYKTINYKILGSLMKKARLNRKLSVTEIAELTGVDRGLISKYEKGERRPTIEFFYNFCLRCHVCQEKLIELSIMDNFYFF